MLFGRDQNRRNPEEAMDMADLVVVTRVRAQSRAPMS